MKWLKGCIVLGIAIFAAHLLLGYLQPNHFDGAAYKSRRAGYHVVIKRDIWGVPHIEGKKDRDVAFGFAYAQAEDHYEIIEESFRMYRGQQSASVGYSGIALDYLIQLLEISRTVSEKYDGELSDDAKAILTGFSDGINYWAAQHPERVDQHLYPVSSQDIVAAFSTQHLLFYGFQNHVMALFGDERLYPISLVSTETALRLSHQDPLPIGSNAFAVAPGKSTDGKTRLLINSHQPLTGPVTWFEAHLKSETGWHMMGGAFPGSPLLFVGVNEHVGWGATVNKPDLVDVFVLDINPENENQYRLDGRWVDLVVKEAAIRVKLLGNFYWTVKKERLYSEHGPVLRRDHGTYAIRYAGQGEIRQIDQWLAMNKATGMESWRDAMRMLALSSFNFIVADRAGNIGFFHNSQSPIRKAGYDWKQYLPGNRGDLIWEDYLPFDDLPQLVNPESGYLFSANQSPFRVTADPYNQKRSDYPETYGFPKRMTNRATRGLALFETMDKIGEAEFQKIKFDKYYARDSRAIHYLSGLDAITSEGNSRYGKAQRFLKGWDLGTDVANTGAALGVCVISDEWTSEQKGATVPGIKAVFERCVDRLYDIYGRVDVAWGDVNRLTRGDVNLPVAGGPDIMRAVYGTGLAENGYLTAVAGDGLFIFASWDEGGVLETESIHQFGSATLDKDSKHYADQAALFADEKMKPTYFGEGQLEGHIEREYSP